MLTLLTMWEDSLERFIFRPLRRLLALPLEQADLAKHLARAMHDKRDCYGGKLLVAPNLYEIQLCIEDFNRFKSHEKLLLLELSDYLINFAARHGMTLFGRPEIRLTATKELTCGEIRVSTKLVDRITVPTQILKP